MRRAPTTAELRAILSRCEHGPAPVDEGAHAAVAAVFRDAEHGAELLFILRAEHPRDPWSGHMAWPGGRVDARDTDPLAAAIRETREELTLDLARDGELLGALPPARTHLRRGPGPRTVFPFAFALRHDVTLRPNHEVQEALWVPLRFLLDRANRGLYLWTGRGIPVVLPCIRFEGRVIWGLTLGMLDGLTARLARDGGGAEADPA